MKFEKSSRATKSFDKPEFLSYGYGQHRVRFLGFPKLTYIHFFYGRGSIECLGNDCPVCARNREIRAENPNDYRDHPQYKPWSERHYINALDRTPVVICPECGNEMKADQKGRYPSRCTECDVFVGEVDPQPLSKVRIVNLSKTNKEILELIDVSVLDQDKNPIGVENMDIIFMVTKTGNRKNISIKEDTSAMDKVEVPEDALFDLDQAVIKLSVSETEDFMNGVFLKDIFTSRNGNSPDPSVQGTALVDTEEKQNIDDAKKRVDSLFKTLTN